MSAPATAGPMQSPATWDAVAPGYAEEIAAQMAPYGEEALRLAALLPSDRVLDVACGPGTLAFLAAPRAASVAAVDFSSGMIEQLKLRAGRASIANIEAAMMDAQSLTFPDESFDVAFCMFGFMFFPDRARAYRELMRVLRPGGRAVIATWGPIDRRPMMKVGFDALAEALPDLPRPPKGDLQQPEECVAEMTETGFRDVEATTFTASVHVDSAEEYVRVMERSGAPFAALRKKLGLEAWAPVAERFLAAVRRRLPDGAADLSAEAILTRGVR